MGVLTADRTVPAHKQVIQGAYYVDFPVAATTVIYRGGFVGVNAAGDLVMHAPEDLTATQGTHKFVGIAQEHIVSQTSAGDATCRVLIEGYFQHDLSSAIKADVGKAVYVTDDQTIAKEGACSIDVIGKIVHLDSAGTVIVKLADFGTGPGMITRVINDFEGVTAGSTVMLLHESENHNGAYIADAAAVTVSAIDTDSAAAVVTLAHTTGTETSTGVTLTVADNVVADELIISSALGKLYGVGTAQIDNMILIPADKAVMAVLTTTGAGAGSPTSVWNIAVGIVLL